MTIFAHVPGYLPYLDGVAFDLDLDEAVNLETLFITLSSGRFSFFF